ncbi:hypothetical protein BKA64DRAFT_650702 [Cadophora sp. MPI-SDFR-AT-0126]|nr:hypothetical protein BKA64DRAFT_650702 [Leotiomycetes sp. MPI-SDFR-AT-0126]
MPHNHRLNLPPHLYPGRKMSNLRIISDMDIVVCLLERIESQKLSTSLTTCGSCKDRRLFSSVTTLRIHFALEYISAMFEEGRIRLWLLAERLLMSEQVLLAKQLLLAEQLLLACRYLELLFRRLLQFLTSYSRFGGFRDRRRPKCTTMPWSIWPSLVVLWGVCWMFVAPWSDVNFLNAYLEDREGEGHAWPFSQNIFPSPDFAPVSLGVDQFLDNIGNEAVADSNLFTGYTNHNTCNDFAGYPSKQDLFVSIPSLEAANSSANVASDFENPPNDRHQFHTLRQVMFKDPNGVSYAQIRDLNQREGSAINNHHLTPPPSAAVIPSSSRPQLAEQSSRGSIIAPEQQESPPRNSEGNYICVGYGCSDEKTFRIRSDWQIHVNQHTRPYKCSVEGCPYRSATKGVLVRHKYLKHSVRHSVSSDLVGVSGAGSTSRIENGESVLASADEIPAVTDRGKAKAKRKFADDEDENEEDDYNQHGTGSRMVQKNAKLTRLDSTHRGEELARENEKLRQELKRVQEDLLICRAERDEEKKERAKLLSIFDRVTKQMN